MWTIKKPEPEENLYLYLVQVFSPDGETQNLYTTGHRYGSYSFPLYRSEDLPFSGPKIIAEAYGGKWHYKEN